MRRMGSPDEVGQLAVYLASDDAAWITGKVFRIDGGQVVAKSDAKLQRGTPSNCLPRPD